MIELAQKIQTLTGKRLPFVLVTLTEIKGSAPQIEGAKMLVTAQGLYWGTVGGGKIEAHCIRYAQEMLREHRGAIAQTWNLQNDIKMSCGGEVSLFFDTHHPNDWHIAVFGAGHVSQELCRVLSTWSCQISVFDSRTEWLERLPASANLDKSLCHDMSAIVSKLPQGSFLLCMTQGHGSDVPVLKEAFAHADKFALIGVIGSDVKSARIRSELCALGVAKELVDKLACPLGLPLGDNTPSEIAVSICAQLLALRDRVSFRVENGDLL